MSRKFNGVLKGNKRVNKKQGEEIELKNIGCSVTVQSAYTAVISDSLNFIIIVG
jgi:predicted DNA-binding antitoxin AbrB/MazE fold protein